MKKNKTKEWGKKSSYKQVMDSEWVQPIRHGYKMMCCDCGLVHTMNFRIVKDKRKRNFIQFQPSRNERATWATRRGWKGLRFRRVKKLL